jgi:hypothetical protein
MFKYHRQLTVAGALVALCAASQAFAQNPAPTSHEAQLRARDAAVAEKARALVEADKQRPHIGGFWKVDKFVGTVQTIDGKTPPLTAAGRALYRQRIADRKAGKAADPLDRCLPPGTPRALWMDDPFLITQAPSKITFFHQYHHIIRHVFLDGPLKISEPDPVWEGHSAGHWQGDTLVIETANFNGQEWLDEAGLPQSADMKVTERLTLLNPGSLEDRITIEDPKFYTAPWTTRLVFTRLPEDSNLIEEECSEKLLEFPLKNYQPQ